jgi:hypothetical protein
VNFIFPAGSHGKDQVQSRLLSLAALALFLFAAILTLSPAVRLHSWQVTYRWIHWVGYLVWLASAIILHRVTLRLLPDRDPYLLPITALLTGLGLLEIWRLDADFGWRQTAGWWSAPQWSSCWPGAKPSCRSCAATNTSG